MEIKIGSFNQNFNVNQFILNKSQYTKLCHVVPVRCTNDTQINKINYISHRKATDIDDSFKRQKTSKTIPKYTVNDCDAMNNCIIKNTNISSSGNDEQNNISVT